MPPPFSRRPLSPTPLQVWAVEDTSVQLTWGRLPPGPLRFTARCGRIPVADVVVLLGDDGDTGSAGSAGSSAKSAGGSAKSAGGSAGAVELTGLPPASDIEITALWGRGTGEGSTVLGVTTLAPPPGAELCRVATISDLHLGSTNWGASNAMRDRSGHPVPFPLRCARAALTEAVAWGAELIVVKGDAAHHQRQDDFDQVGKLLDEFPDTGVLLLPGNHDVDGHTSHSLPAKVGQRGVPYVRSATSVDLPGLRIVAANTTIPGRGHGQLNAGTEEAAELAAMAPGPYLLALHHHLHRYRIPTCYPLGVAAPASNRYLDGLAGLNPAGLVTSGHTHRNRSRRHGPLAVSEVSATRDWPGVWAGYAVHEGGIRQVVRRAAAPDAVSWHEYSARALLGIWETWAQGPMRQRCFSHRWLR